MASQPDERPDPTPGGRSRSEVVWVVLVCVLVAWNYLADARRIGGGAMTARDPGSYYGLLTQALLDGRVSLEIPVDPKLLRLENPYAGPQGTLRPHDMSFYKGKFYLYYGIAPALVLFVPWKALCGVYPTEVTATALFCLGAYLLATFWLLRVRKTLFPTLATGWVVLFLLVLGFGSPIYFLSNNATFYAVPISAACFFLSAAATAIQESVLAKNPRRAAAWLALASLASGLSVGARPDYILSVAALLVPAAWLACRHRAGEYGARQGRCFYLAAILPAAGVGIGLALYNYARFDNPLDFGMQYSMASADLRGTHLVGVQYIPKNLRLYLLHPARYVRYYPFFYSGGRPFGVLPHLPLVALALGFPLTLLSNHLRRSPLWLVGVGFAVCAGIANFAVLCVFFGGEDRYLADFVPLLLAAACAVAAAQLGALQGGRSAARVFRWALSGLSLWTLANGAFFGVANRVQTPFRARLEAALNRIVYGVEDILRSERGPLRLVVRFPAPEAGRKEPLLTTGTPLGAGDILYVSYVDSTHVRFGYFHLGAGGPTGDPVEVDFAKSHTVDIALGSLYPPRHHPIFSRWTDAQVSTLKRRLEVRLDGRLALSASVNVYPATPDGVWVGSNPLAADVSEPAFTGKIISQQRTPVRPPDVPDPATRGPIRLLLRLPADTGGTPQPLVCTGHGGAGDLVSILVTPDGRVVFVHDCWNASDFRTQPVKVDLSAVHTVVVEMGSLYPPGDARADETLRHRLSIWLDGHLVADAVRPFNQSTADEVDIGVNAIGASSATGMYAGFIGSATRVPVPDHVQLPQAWGPVRITLALPTDATGHTEPLVSTGIPGSSDIVSITYMDDRHVAVGIREGPGVVARSGAIPVDYAVVHAIEVRMPSLLPPAGSPAWRNRPATVASAALNRVQVALDGKTVLEVRHVTLPSAPAEVAIGRNDVDASSCDREFSGHLVSFERLAW